MGMFDFDGNGHTSFEEHFIGYQIFRDVTGSGSSGSSGGSHRGRLDGFTVLHSALDKAVQVEITVKNYTSVCSSRRSLSP